ncbi:MAG TPA: hypothetical protein VKV79_07495 [Terriglobia bacterium]|nr:hypothetical protein [Terriglobia bacterium]
MRQPVSKLSLPFFSLVICGAFAIALWGASAAQAMPLRKKRKISSNNPTTQLFNILNNSFGGKLDLYLLAGVYSDPSQPTVQYQRVLHVTYDKSLYFGRFMIHVRSVGKLNSQQLIIYTPKQVFDFGNRDSEEFEKINPGRFGATGDLYLAASGDNPLAAVPVTEEVRQQYDSLLTKYVLPAVEKEAGGKS